MSRWRKYPNLRAWIVGRILFGPARTGAGLLPSSLAKPPGYLLASSLDVDDALRELRDSGVLTAMQRRWYVRNIKLAKKIGKPLAPKGRS